MFRLQSARKLPRGAQTWFEPGRQGILCLRKVSPCSWTPLLLPLLLSLSLMMVYVCDGPVGPEDDKETAARLREGVDSQD